MSEILLTDEQKVLVEELKKGIANLEEAIAEPFRSDSGDEIAEMLSHHSNLAAYSPRLIEIATLLFGAVRKTVAVEIVNDPKFDKTKDSILKMYMAGRMMAIEPLYEKLQVAVKGVDKHLEQLRSLLAYLKEQMKKHA